MRMSAGNSHSSENRLLQALPANTLAELSPMMTSVRMVVGQVLIGRGEAVEHVYFVEHGVVALVAETGRPGSGVQVGMIGREGIVGGLGLVGAESLSFATSVVLIPGTAQRISVEKLQGFLQQSALMREICGNHLGALVRQTMQFAAYGVGNSLTQRCVRWLLMAHDRVDGDELRITHQALATMLGVRRAGVTVVAASLQAAGLIKVNRGRITILDRAGLAALAGDLASTDRVAGADLPGPVSPMLVGCLADPAALGGSPHSPLAAA